MSEKTYVTDVERAPESQIGATLDALYATIESRRGAQADGPNGAARPESYTKTLLEGPLDKLLKKVSEESLEVAMAAKECQMLDACHADAALVDASVDHLRYESADVIYHLLVLLARHGVSADELAAELNFRMREDERPQGCIMLHDEHVKRGK